MRYGLDGRYIQDHFPGIGRYAFNLAFHLATLSPEDDFVILHDPHARNTRYDLGELAAMPNVTMVPAPASVFSLKQQVLLPRLARRFRLALYHCPYYLIPYLLPCPTIATVHDLIPYLHPESLPNPRLRGLFMLIVRMTLARSKHVLVDSEATRRDILRIAHTRPGRVSTVPLAADSAFRPYLESETAPVRARLGLGRPYLLYLGINKPHKNLVRLVQAWGALPPAVRDGHMLVLAGWEDPRYSEVRECVSQLGLAAQVRFLGGVESEDVPLLYAGALGFVFPSVYEGFGLPVLEAMASGAPVACAHSSSLPEIVGEAALTFDPENVKAIRDALGRLLTEPDLRQRLGSEGRLRAENYTWRRTAAETLDVYRQVAAGR